MGGGTGNEGDKGGGGSAVLNVLQRSLKIGRSADDTIKTGAWEAGLSGTGQSQKVQDLRAKFDKLARLYAILARDIEALPGPLVGQLGKRLTALDAATEELEGRVVQNNDTDRDAFLADTKAQIKSAKQLALDVQSATRLAAARKPQVISWQHPKSIIPGTLIKLKMLTAQSDGDGRLELLRRSKVITSIVVNQGDEQPFEIRAAETANCLAATKIVKLNVRAAQRVISWQPPTEMEWAATPTVQSLKATATGEGGPLEIDYAALATVGADRVLRIVAPGSAGWRAASEEAKVNVTLAKRDIAWSPPAKIAFGEAITVASLKAAVSLGSGAIGITTPSKGRFAAAGAGQRIEVKIAATEFYASVTKTATVDVTKAVAEIKWQEPKSVVTGTKLSATQLNANVQPAWLHDPEYDPKKATEMTTAGTVYLRATVKKTRDSESARKEVRLRIHANAQLQLGYESMRDGSAWKRPTAGQAKVLADAWRDDDGTDEYGIKTHGQRLMSNLATMTAEELQAQLNSETAASDRTSTGGTYPNEIWKFPNGLQVRYKSNGSQHDPGVSMFCIEARTSAGFSASQGDIAFKITAEGIPAAKGPSPSDTSIPNTVNGAIALADYKSGTAQSTHLKCRPKEGQVLEWSDPDAITSDTPLSDKQLCALHVEGDGALSYETSAGVALTKGSKLNLGDAQVLRVKAAKTSRYKKAEMTVTINVTSAS